MSAKQRAGSNVACEQPAPPLQNYTIEHRTCHKALISQCTILALKSRRDRYMSSSDMTEGSLTKQQITALPGIFHPRYHIGISQYLLIGNCGQSSSFLASCGGTTTVMVLVVMGPWATSGHCHQKTDERCQPSTTKGICMDAASSKGALWYLLGGVLGVSLVLKTLRVPCFDLALDKEWLLACELMSVHDQITNIWDCSDVLLSGSPCALQGDRWQDRGKKSSSATQHLWRQEQGAEPP